jgi:hypothetical protein
LHATQCTDPAVAGAELLDGLRELLDDAVEPAELVELVDPANGLVGGAVAAGFEEEPPQAAATSITTTAPASAPLIRRSLGMSFEVTGGLRELRCSNG